MTTTKKSTKMMAQHFDRKILKEKTRNQLRIANFDANLLTTFQEKIINATKSTKKSKQVLENLLELEKIRS